MSCDRLINTVHIVYTDDCYVPGSVRPILILFHPRAKFNSDVYPTKDKMADFVDRCEDVIDAVFWEEKVIVYKAVLTMYGGAEGGSDHDRKFG